MSGKAKSLQKIVWVVKRKVSTLQIIVMNGRAKSLQKIVLVVKRKVFRVQERIWLSPWLLIRSQQWLGRDAMYTVRYRYQVGRVCTVRYLGMSVGRLASTDSPGTWIRVGAGGISNMGGSTRTWICITNRLQRWRYQKTVLWIQIHWIWIRIQDLAQFGSGSGSKVIL